MLFLIFFLNIPLHPIIILPIIDLPLHEAASSGRRELVLWLLDQRPKHVNTTSNDGRTILHIAASNDYADMCKVCIRKKKKKTEYYPNFKRIFFGFVFIFVHHIWHVLFSYCE